MNIYEYKVPSIGEEFTTLLQHKNVQINHIVSSDKLEDKIYIQDEDEWVVVLKGSATLLVDNKEIKLKEGDTLFIPAKTSHKVLQTLNDTLWLAMHIF